jgi:hypothetical protein
MIFDNDEQSSDDEQVRQENFIGVCSIEGARSRKLVSKKKSKLISHIIAKIDTYLSSTIE